MARGDFVKVDMGAKYRGYASDFVRSYFIGEASVQGHRDIWQRLNEVQMELGRLESGPGATGRPKILRARLRRDQAGTCRTSRREFHRPRA